MLLLSWKIHFLKIEVNSKNSMDTVRVRKQSVRDRIREESTCPDTATEDYH